MKFVQSFVFILVSFICLIPHKVNAQEIVFVHLERNVIVSGESVFFKAYLLNINNLLLNPVSRILYIQITDPVSKTNLVFRSDVNTNGTCYGEIPIPDTLNTGNYLLTAYTNYMRNFNPGAISTTGILVVNQARKIPDVLNDISISNHSDSISKTKVTTNNLSQSIDVILNKKVFGPREKVTIGLKNLVDSLSISNVSITVTRKNPFNDSGSSETDFCSFLPYISEKTKAGKDHLKTHPETDFCRYPKEDKGFIFSGSLLDKTSLRPIPGVFVLLSVPDSVANLKYAISDSKGKFNFLLAKNYNNRELILQLMNSPVPVENTTIIVENKAFIPDNYNMGTTTLDSTGSEFVTTCQQIAMVNKIYNSGNRTDKLAKDTPIQVYSFLGKPDEIIIPSDFLEMPNMEDIVANIVRDAKYKVTENQSTILVADKFSNQFWDGHNALVLLNNIPVFDYGVINSLGSKQIKRIELITKRMYYGDLEIFGIISIFTNENYIPFLTSTKKVFSFPNEVLIPLNSNNIPDYGLEVNKRSKIPDFRQTLYWNPDFTIRIKAKNTVEFYTSDLKTSYDIVIQGITENGIPLSARTTIEVR